MTGCPGTREKMALGEREVSLCWHTALCGTATRCPLLLAPPFPLHLPQRFTAGIALRQQPLPAAVTRVGCVGRLPVPWGRAQGRTRTLPAYPEERRWWGHDKAQGLTLLCVPSTSDESQTGPNLLPPSSKFTFNLFWGRQSHFLPQPTSHTTHQQARMSPKRMT